MWACTPSCGHSDPTVDTVKLNMAALAKEQEMQEAQEARKRVEAEELAKQRRRLEEEARLALLAEEQRRQEELLEAQCRQEEEQRLRKEREQAERQALQQREREEQLKHEEAVKREQQERERAQAAEREEKERAAAEERKRKAAVAEFLKAHGFDGGVRGPMRSIVNTTYPLHRAAKLGDAKMVEMLLREGADPAQKNSSGKTPGQVAQKHDSNNSHAEVVRLLVVRG